MTRDRQGFLGGVSRWYLPAARMAIVFAALLLRPIGGAKADTFSALLQPAEPKHLSLTLFGAGYGSEAYGVTHEGFDLEQSITRGIGVMARVSTYQIYHGTGYDTPLNQTRREPFFFGRFEGGINLSPMDGTNVAVLGGNDAGDSHSPLIEGSISTWINIHSAHPINFSISSSHYFQNNLSNGLIDLRTVVMSSGELMLLGGAGAIVWGGNLPQGAQVQGGPDVGFFLRRWKIRVEVQGGYGFHHEYGLVAFSRDFDWEE